jgi:nicotinate dehydrogenase subunit B
MSEEESMTREFTLTRRGFVKAGGALFVGVALFPEFTGLVEPRSADAATLDATKLASWLEIRDDGTIVARTGKTETGTSASAFYSQVVAEELDVQPSSIRMIMGSTDETPDGGLSAGFLSGVANLKKVAALTRTALLGVAATRLGVAADSLTVANGVVTGGGKSVSYAELVKGQQLDLTIPLRGALPAVDPKEPLGMSGITGLSVASNPPVKPIAQYKVIGESFERRGIRDIVTGKAQYGADVTVPGLLYARMVRPATLGSTLISAGKIDRGMFPNAEVVVRGNFVAVVAPNEWEAMQAAQSVAAATQWTPWSGLPTSDKVIDALRACSWALGGKRGDTEKVDAALAKAAKVITAKYEQPYVRHAPMGAFVATADVKADGSITIWAQSSNPQAARANIANTMGVPVDKVTIKWTQGPGQYGRTTWGGDSAMADAAIVSKLVGKPVRVQWTLAEDLAWSTVSPAWYSELKAGLDANGNLVGFKSDWYAPHENDARMVGAILAGMPTVTRKVGPVFGANSAVNTVWPYDKAPAFEQAYFTENLGVEAAGGGLRGNIMRTPWQRQQNLGLEGIITEAAAAAGADQIEFRRRHTTNEPYLGMLDAVAKAHGWKERPSPNPQARRTGATAVTGRGVGVVIRSNAPWVAIADVEVTPSTGVVKVTALTVGVDVGKVMNPRHLKSMCEGGAVMGIGEALFEEVTFDTGSITSTSWSRYRIPRMGDVPPIKTVFNTRADRGINSGGEAANTATPVAIMAAFFDATGVMPRRIPLTPAYVTSLLRG